MRALRNNRPMLKMAVFSLVAMVIGTIVALAIDWFPTPASTAAKDIDTLWDVLLVASVPIFVLVMAVALYSVTAFRARPGDLSDGAPIHGNTRLEVIWVTIPFILVSALAVYGWIVLDDIEAKQNDPLIVDVRGQQFAWDFTYPKEGKVKSNELVLPVDRPVELNVRTSDVIHSFWVPQFRLKTDSPPGVVTRVRVTPNREGEYSVVCAELCGIGHATMRQDVKVIPAAEFDKWLAKEQGNEADGGAAAAGGDQAAAGKQVFTDNNCGGCHQLADAGSTEGVGPSLDKLTADARKYGKQEGQSPEEYVQTSIADPEAFVVPGEEAGVMPAYEGQLSAEEIDSLVKYLLSVSGGGK